MEILQGYRYRARPDARQATLFARTAGCCRTLRNAALEQRTLAYGQQRRSLSYGDQSAELKEVKEAFPWMAEAPHHCLQSALRELQTGFKNFFEGRAAYPKFHRKGENDSFTFPDRKQIHLLPSRGRKGRIKLPKAGVLSFVKHREVEGEVRSVTISREADGWYVSVLTRREVPDPVPVEGAPVGIDLGVANTVTLSEGRGRFCVPRASPGEAERMRRLQRKLSRQRKGSRSREKTRKRIARLHQRVRRRRTDALHRLSFHLAQSHGRVYAEALDVRAMTASARGTEEEPGRNVRQKAGLNRSILAQGWGELRRQLKYKSQWRGSSYAEVPAAHTSQTCARCGHVAKENRRSQSDFLCARCGYAAHADENAADNILARGTRVAAGGALAEIGRATKPEFR